MSLDNSFQNISHNHFPVMPGIFNKQFACYAALLAQPPLNKHLANCSQKYRGFISGLFISSFFIFTPIFFKKP